MPELTAHQIAALDSYQALRAARPDLFAGRAGRPIVADRAEMAEYARRHGMVLGIAAETPYVLFIVDLVRSHAIDGSSHSHPYLRVVNVGQMHGGEGVVVIATIDNAALGRTGDIVLIRQERHALGTVELELPRGFAERGVSGASNALKELAEETGFIGTEPFLLGHFNVDSGLTDARVSFYHVLVTGRQPARPENAERILSVHLVSRDELWAEIGAGRIRDSFSVQALALYERRAAAKR